jgi:hypothetical protein
MFLVLLLAVLCFSSINIDILACVHRIIHMLSLIFFGFATVLQQTLDRTFMMQLARRIVCPALVFENGQPFHYEPSAGLDDVQLSVPVQGHKSLQSSLAFYFSGQLHDDASLDNQSTPLALDKKVRDTAYWAETKNPLKDTAQDNKRETLGAKTQLRLKAAGNVMTFHLNRTYAEKQRGGEQKGGDEVRMKKANNRFEFPHTLNLRTLEMFAETVDQKALVDENQPSAVLFDLTAVIVHVGGSAISGHYKVFIKIGQDW